MANFAFATLTMRDGGNIILVGMMCSGKSAAGAALADMLRLRFVDIDAKVEADSGESVAGIFANKGEEMFRHLESRQLRNALKKGGQVIATGGGIVCTPGNIRQMRADIDNAVCYLRAPSVLLAKRASMDSSARPLLADAGDMLGKVRLLNKIFAKRKKLYEKAAHCVVDACAIHNPTDTAEYIARAVFCAARFGDDSV